MTPTAKMAAQEAVIICLLRSHSHEKADSIMLAAKNHVKGWIDVREDIKENAVQYLENMWPIVTDGTDRE